MKNVLPLLALSLSLFACGGPPPAANDPRGTATPSGATTTATAAPSTTAAPSSGGACKSADAPGAAKDLDACKAECQKLDDTSPPGSRCVPPRTSCVAQCNDKFKK